MSDQFRMQSWRIAMHPGGCHCRRTIRTISGIRSIKDRATVTSPLMNGLDDEPVFAVRCDRTDRKDSCSVVQVGLESAIRCFASIELAARR